MKAMVYIKTTACPDLGLKEFTAEWNRLTSEDQEEIRQWARAEGKVVGVEVD